MDFPQAGGKGLLKMRDLVMKPTRESEFRFYCNPPLALRDFIPKFYGGGFIGQVRHEFSDAEFQVCINKGYTHYILLENLITNLQQVDIVDIKLGSVHWIKTEDPVIIESHHMRNANSLTTSHKWRIDGVYTHAKYTKEECRNFSTDQADSILLVFNKIEIDIIIRFINMLIDALYHTDLYIYGPSLLIVKNEKYVTIKLIDFAVYEVDGDDDLVPALESFRQFLIDRNTADETQKQAWIAINDSLVENLENDE